MRSNQTHARWTQYFIGCLSLLCLSPVNAFPQVPNLQGEELGIDGTLGVSCRSDKGSPTSIFVQGGSVFDDPSAVVGVVIPLHPKSGDCSKILNYEEAMARLMIAERLLERGLITPEEYKTIADEVHEVIKLR